MIPNFFPQVAKSDTRFPCVKKKRETLFNFCIEMLVYKLRRGNVTPSKGRPLYYIECLCGSAQDFRSPWALFRSSL